MVDCKSIAERAYNDSKSGVRECGEPDCYACRRKAEDQTAWFARAIAEQLDPEALGRALDEYGSMYGTGARGEARAEAIRKIRQAIIATGAVL